MKPRDLIAHAERLAAASKRKPHQADLRRAVSAAYYALFHAVAGAAADTLIGTSKQHRASVTWSRVYRSLEHGFAKSQCLAKPPTSQVPATLIDVADAFVQLQELRHEADYDPNASFLRKDVEAHIRQADTAILNFDRALVSDRRIFAAWLIFKNKA